jgi:hypothetical protein
LGKGTGRAENVESGKLKCATKIAAGGFPAAAGRHRAIELARGSGSGLGKYYKTRNRPVHKHQNPYFGLGSPETVKLLILEDFFKGDTVGTMPLQNATIWEKSEGYIVATGADKEWIHSGTYTIQN